MSYDNTLSPNIKPTLTGFLPVESTEEKTEQEHQVNPHNSETAKRELEFSAAVKQHQLLQLCEDPLFPSDYYWDALLRVGKGQKKEAEELIESAQTSNPLKISFSWLAFKPDNIESFFDKLFVDSLKRKPQELNQIGLLESIGVQDHNKRLNDCSIKGRKTDLRIAKANLKTLESYDFESLTTKQQLSYKIFLWTLRHQVEGEKFLFHDYPVTTMYSVFNDLSETLTQFHKIETEDDFTIYQERLCEIPKQFKQVIEYMREQERRGIKPPKFALRRVIRNLKTFIETPVPQNPFYNYCEAQIDKLPVNSGIALEWLQHLIKSKVLPAYTELKEFLEKLLLNTKTNHSLLGLPDGKAYYAYCLKQHTTTDLTPEEIHQLGKKEVAKIQEEMRGLLQSVGIKDPKKGAGELMAQLGEDEKHFYPNTTEGREACIKGFQDILERSRRELSQYFDLKPDEPVKIIPTPKHEEEVMPGAYYKKPSFDGSREGIFYVNLRNMKEVPKFGMETLVAHEAEPEHHFQLTLQVQSNTPLLRRRAWFNAYIEGWALYTEKLAYEKGFFTSAYDKLGHLQDELLRAVRLIVDTGIHGKGWTREFAIDFMQRELGYKRETVVTEIERYFSWPGQACSYKLGQLIILELRKKAMDTLGDKFDIREFHNAILRVGAVPLTILEEVIDAYIGETMLQDAK